MIFQLASLIFLSAFSSISTTSSYVSDLQDANHIFNSIHSSLRQFGSSLRHNGMSVFLASVPAGQDLYHGSGKPDPVTGMEWLAFEPEHAMMFARYFKGGWRRPPPDKDKGRRPPPGDGQHPLQNVPDLLHERHPLLELMDRDDDDDGTPKFPPETKPGWLHTYRTKHDLRLLYVDGMGAAKAPNGTMDSQDFLILLGMHGTHPDMWDIERGLALCAVAEQDWGGKIDGFIRMEVGFEIILCDFEKHLDTVYVNRVNDFMHVLEDDGGGSKEPVAADVWFDYWRAIMDRSNGFPGGRVKVHYDDFVTAYNRDLDLFSDDPEKPRLLNLSKSALKSLRADVDQLVEASDSIFADTNDWFNWQAIADFLVTRYASRLQYLTSAKFAESKQYLHSELTRTLSPFIDFDNRSIATEIQRCTTHFLPANPPQPLFLVSEAITSISHTICSHLFAALTLSSNDTESSSAMAATGLTSSKNPYAILHSLMAYLEWSTWKECGTCSIDEVCVLPVWPFGSWEDHIQPSCHNATVGWSQRGYWGGRF